jgi:hypothetical protein
MKHPRLYSLAALLCVTLIAVSVLLFGSASAQDEGKNKEAAPKVKWEYKVIRVGEFDRPIDEKKTEAALNDLGNEGWECIATVSEVRARGSSKGVSSIWTEAVMTFKRLKK